MKKAIQCITVLLIVTILLSACASTQQAVEPTTSQATPTVAKSSYAIWFAPYLPQELTAGLNLPENTQQVSDQTQANFTVDVSADHPLAQWIYVVVAPFDTVADGISFSDLQALWQGTLNDNLPVDKLIMSSGTKSIFEKLWGSASGSTVDVVSDNAQLDVAWGADKTWAIIPFEQLEPKWKVIAVDNQSPIQKAFNADAYNLKVPFSLIGNNDDVAKFVQAYGPESSQPMLPTTNRDPNKLTTVVVTGVTALVRGTAYLMQKNGMTYPAIDIGDTLRDADILHISNEIPFTDTCPNPFTDVQDENNLVFCSKPEYIQLLESIGTDVVELTGDHFRDWGPDAMLNTIDMYNKRGWKYYGGGINLEDAMKPALFDVNGNKIAFIGCNGKTPGYATASANTPGAVHCDMDAEAKVIKQVVSEGYMPIFTFQHIEYYSYSINKNLVPDFEKAAEAGAVIVSGSQAHQPHGFEFYNGSLIHYGLGNLFFDQYNEGFPERQAFIDRHVFYGGKYISTELLTIMFTDMARSRFMTQDERTDLLRTVFSVSNWSGSQTTNNQ